MSVTKPLMRGWSSIAYLFLGEAKVSYYSRRFYPQFVQIYLKLFEAFWYLTEDRINRALEAMKLLCSFSGDRYIAIQSNHLFNTIMKIEPSPVFSRQKNWEASRLAFHVAYKSDEDFSPSLEEDPQRVLDF